MSDVYGWVKSAAQQLSDQRQVAGWRPATVEAASFSSRSMRVLRTLRRLEHVLRPPIIESVVQNCCAEVMAYLLVWLHELDVNELALVATTPPTEDTGWPDLPPGTSEVRDHVLDAWEAWSEDRVKRAAVDVGAAVVDMLEFCRRRGFNVEKELFSRGVDFGKRKPGSRHPDTW